MPLSKFESMLKTDKVYFFDSLEFEEIIHHYIDNGRLIMAEKAIKLGLDQHPASVNLKLLKAELLVVEGAYSEAEKLLNDLMILEPTNEEVYIQKASIFSKKNDHLKAVESLEKALEYSDDATDVLALLGMEYLFLDDFLKARLSFQKCLEQDAEDFASLYNLIYCYDMEEKHEEAVDYLRSYLDQNPYCEVAWHQLGRQYFVLRAYEKALQAFDYAILIDESFVGGYLEKAKTLEFLARYEEAIETYKITLELDDPTSFVFLRMGECFLKINALEQAIESYEKAVHEDPLSDKVWAALSDAYFQKAAFSKSLHCINKALTIDELKATYWIKKAEIKTKLKAHEEAITSFKTALDLGNNQLEVWLALVDLLYWRGDFQEALRYLVHSKNTHKAVAAIEYRFFGLLMETQNTETALLHLKNALALDFDLCSMARDLFPKFFEFERVKAILSDFER